MASNFYKFESFGEKTRFFFNGFPYVEYDILGNGEKNKIRNFLRRFDFTERVRKFGSIYTKWIVREEDTPQVIAHKLYNSTHYYWIILMINKMHDPTFDFPMTELELTAYVDRKYGVENRRALHHYESRDTGDVADLPDGIWVDETYPSKEEVDNFEYEYKLNDDKRHILMLKPEYLEQVLQELSNIMNSKFTRVKS
jgi:hypothetical protein